MATNPKPKPGPGRPEIGIDLKLPITSFKGRPPFKRWFDSLRQHTRLSGATLIEMALVEYAKNHGYPEPPPPR